VTATDLIEALGRHVVVLGVEGGRLRYRCLRGALPSELRQAASERREELIELLGRPTQPVSTGNDGGEAPAAVTQVAAPHPRADHRLPCCCPAAICYRCWDRPCENCGRPTGSASIRTCFACGHLIEENEGLSCGLTRGHERPPGADGQPENQQPGGDGQPAVRF
jgi:hypothetical protein